MRGVLDAEPGPDGEQDRLDRQQAVAIGDGASSSTTASTTAVTAGGELLAARVDLGARAGTGRARVAVEVDMSELLWSGCRAGGLQARARRTPYGGKVADSAEFSPLSQWT